MYMKTVSVIKKIKIEIENNNSTIKELANDYIDTPSSNTEKCKSILKKLQAAKDERAELKRLLKRVERRKETMVTMVWKRDKTLIENILENI